VPGDRLLEPDGSWSQVLATAREEHPEGVAVFNFRVEQAHTYFVRAEGSTARPVWVHNASYELVPDPAPRKYRVGWEGTVVRDHRLSRAIGRLLGVDADVARNIANRGFATNARKGALERQWIESYLEYRQVLGKKKALR